jgi:serine phosphatase RsbU (regulator of sigma subunit)
MMARNIQQQFIPSSDIADYICFLYRPMDMVGGDFYDFFITDKGISEVSGGRSVPVSFMDNEFLIEKNKDYKNDSITLPENGKLFLYTDGLTEAEKKDEKYLFFEDAGLKEFLIKNRHLPCKPYVDSLLAELIEF